MRLIKLFRTSAAGFYSVLGFAITSMFFNSTLALAQDEQPIDLWTYNNGGTSLGIEFGYVSKQWVTDLKDGGDKLHEDIFGREDRRLHGLQIGVGYKPLTRYGLGASTGLFYEAYFASGRDYGYDRFVEHNLYLPLHALFQIPFSYDFSMSLECGLGLSYVLSGDFMNDDDYYYNEYGERYHPVVDHLDYSRFGNPKHFNAALEFGIGLKIDKVSLRAIYSLGITDHHLYTNYPRSTTYQNKINVSLILNIDNED